MMEGPLCHDLKHETQPWAASYNFWNVSMSENPPFLHIRQIPSYCVSVNKEWTTKFSALLMDNLGAIALDSWDCWYLICTVTIGQTNYRHLNNHHTVSYDWKKKKLRKWDLAYCVHHYMQDRSRNSFVPMRPETKSDSSRNL